MRKSQQLTALFCVVAACRSFAKGAELFQDDFSAGVGHWRPYFAEGSWQVREGFLSCTEKTATTGRLADVQPVADVIVEADVRVAEDTRRNFGIIVRAKEDGTCLVARYYDNKDALELLSFTKGKTVQPGGASRPVKLKAGTWHRVKVAVVDDMILAKIWPIEGGTEPDWQLHERAADKTAGAVGLLVDDGSQVDFRNVRVAWGGAVTALQQDLAREREQRQQRIKEKLRLQVEDTPFVLRSPEGPMRRVMLRTMVDDTFEPVDGTLTATLGERSRKQAVKAAEFAGGAYALAVPEPQAAGHLKITFETAIGKQLTAEIDLKPARPWTFYMTPHTHYDIGFTHPQPEVIERLANDMELAVKYCDETAGWPAESRYRWTVEVSALMREYMRRHTPEQIDKFMELARQKRIEICGFYLNMPTELVGHEELIRCLYFAEELRREYKVPIDTVMINDVPGYAWALPELFAEAGIRRAAFRANSIRGQFLWYRPGAVERPFYWEGPEGSRVFVWYTDSYREGNFFRAGGLHEQSFLAIIRQNEAAGTKVDDIQLRMGGDNLPPDINASRNARAFNEKYVWPKVVVATNREYLDLLESRYGAQCRSYRGDIPSWWAEGPASSAQETGLNRLVHDQLVGIEALWTRAWLTHPGTTYPRDRINQAYDKMLHYDEHTWGASGSISKPKSPETLTQWKWKADYAYDAKRLADELQQDVLRQLSAAVPPAGDHSLAVWNTLAWPRTDVVELLIDGTPIQGAAGIEVTDPRLGKTAPAQLSADGRKAWFIARDVPALGCAVYTLRRSDKAAPTAAPNPAEVLENEHYRLAVAPSSGGWSSWYDKKLKRELLDAKAPYRANQALFETAVGGREAIDRKQPVEFRREPAKGGTLKTRRDGPLFSEIVTTATLPTCPVIEQTVRLYHHSPMVDVINVVTKEENFDTEGVYFAFPFDMPSPDIRLQIADATMRPGKDQLTYTCQDFYSIQHWASVGDGRCNVLFAPIDAPLLVVSDLNAYKWADKLDFDKGHLYSWVMNNCWSTNFKAGQSGDLTFRYRLTSHAGVCDPAAASQFAWQPFHPLQTVWLKPTQSAPDAGTDPLVSVTGDPVVVSCVKVAETGDAVIVRLLEMQGKAARCTVKLELPDGQRMARAYLASAVEVAQKDLAVSGGTVTVELRANEIATVGLVPARE